MKSRIFRKQWLYLKKHKCVSQQYTKILQMHPSCVFQLHFWCDLIFYIKITHGDIPDEVVFYLHDKNYMHILDSNQCQSVRQSVSYKIELLEYILGMSIKAQYSNLRQGFEECLMIAKSHHNLSKSQILAQQTLNKTSIELLAQHMQKKTIFTIDKLTTMISKYMMAESQLLANFCNQKNLTDLYDISLTNILTNHITGTFLKCNIEYIDDIKYFEGNKITRSCIKNVIIGYRKQKIVCSMRDYLLRSNKPQFIQFIMDLAYKFKLEKDIFKIQNLFYSSSLAYNSQTDSQIMYKIFIQELLKNNCTNMPAFQRFMIQNLAGKTIALHNLLIINVQNQNQNLSVYKILELKDQNIYNKLKASPVKTSQQCMKFYLFKSNFKNPYTNNLLSIKSTDEKYRPNILTFNQISEPFLFFTILKQFWNHPFHKQVLNFCLWINIEHWFLYTSAKITENLKIYQLQSKIQIEEYKRVMGLTIFQFMMGFEIGNIVKYYPIQSNLILDILYLPSCSQLILQNKKSLFINWLSQVLSVQYKIIIQQKGGYDLAYQLLKRKRNSLQSDIAEYLLTLIQSQFQKGIDNLQMQVYKSLKKILQQFSENWKYKERVIYLETTFLDTRDNDLF